MNIKLSSNDYNNDKFINICTFSGGVDSTAGLLLLINNNIRIDYIVFADTGAEHEYTYNNINYVIDKFGLRDKFVQISLGYSIIDFCLKYQSLPSIAFGYKQCSKKFKIDPVQKWIKSKNFNLPIKKFIFYNYDETRRYNNARDKEGFGDCYFPFIDSQIYRDELVEYLSEYPQIIAKKSSCFICPNMKKLEILELNQAERDTVIMVEKQYREGKNYRPEGVQGLGRKISWTSVFLDSNKDVVSNEHICECAD